ncbi:hypothetical protein A4F85_04605 [Delftia sp. GW456-R20]|uniref:hypothetical protein n=1 Tax=Delftia sp. GW456-R20 TaxID=1827145 RepID=UPI0007AEA42D|nr:hypothetical protein [Delftia sp. GW456-R20]KZK32002.1 hypothetical protein A4F85_04605 [Delftia sp. GW456-R20]
MNVKPFPLYPLAGIDNTSARDDALQVGGAERRVYVREAVNVTISHTGRASMRPGLRKVSGLALDSLWQSPLHGDVFAVQAGQWVKVDTSSWDSAPLAEIGPGPAQHLVLNNLVLVAGTAGIFQFDGQAAQRFALDTPPAPMVTAGAGSLAAGAYGVAVAWLRGAMESPLSPMTQCKVGPGGALDVILPLCMDATVTGARLYLTRPDGGELLRGEDYSIGLAQVSIALLPSLGAGAQFRHMEPMPTGPHFGYWRGRLVSARANVLRFSEALAYHVHDPRHGFVQMPQRITFLQPVDGGLWVGQVDHVAFLAGAAPADLQLVRKTSKAPVPGSAVALDAETAGEASGGGSAVVAWLASNGYVMGTADGSVVEPQGKRLTGIAGAKGTSIVFANRLTTAVI